MSTTADLIREYKLLGDYKNRGYSASVSIPSEKLCDLQLNTTIHGFVLDLTNSLDKLWDICEKEGVALYIGDIKLF